MIAAGFGFRAGASVASLEDAMRRADCGRPIVCLATTVDKAKATIDQASEMLNIMRDILLTVRLDNRERLRQMILKSKARLEGALVPSGHGFVSRRLSSSFNP